MHYFNLLFWLVVDQYHSTIQERIAFSVSLEIECVLKGKILQFALMLLKGVAQSCQSIHEVISQIEAHHAVARIGYNHRSLEIVHEVAFKCACPFLKGIPIIRAVNVCVVGIEVLQQGSCVGLPFRVSNHGYLVLDMILLKVAQFGKEHIQGFDACVVWHDAVCFELIQG